MKKTITCFFLFVTFLSAQKGFSQNLPVKLGLQVSPNLAWLSPKATDYNSDGAVLGVTIGLISDFYFAERYAFSTGLNFSFINGKMNFPDSIPAASGKTSLKYNFIYLEIPMMIKMSTRDFGKYSFYGQIGFGTGFRLTASTKGTFIDDATNKETDVKNDVAGNTSLIRESVIIGFGTEYHLDESSRILVGLSYSNALNNVLTGSNKKTFIEEKALLNLAELKIGFIF